MICHTEPVEVGQQILEMFNLSVVEGGQSDNLKTQNFSCQTLI